MRRLVIIVSSLLLVAAFAFLCYREYVHAGDLLVPAVITPDMNARATLFPGISARFARLIRGPAQLADRPKLIALTFDDGPYPISTPLLLDVLDDLHVPATFFLIGQDAQQYPELARRLVAAGEEITNHTMIHPNLERLDPDAVRAQLSEAANVLRRYTDNPSARTMMRPPGGRFTVQTIEVVQRAGYDVILWNDDPGDWEGFTAAEMLRHIGQKATAPEILLLHMGVFPTIEMLPELVKGYRAAGYTFVTVQQLLDRAGVTAVNDPARVSLLL